MKTSILASIAFSAVALSQSVTVTSSISAALPVPTGTLSNPTYALCTAQNDECKTSGPGANQAFCAAQYCGCLESAGAFSQAPGYCPVPGSSSSTTSSAPVPTGTLSNPTYALCSAQEDECRTAPGGNQAFCSSQYCSCLASAGALSQAPSYFVVPGSSSSTTSSAPIPTGTLSNPTYSTCTGQYDVCQTSPNSNHAFCAAQYCGCLESGGALSQGPSYCPAPSSSSSTASAPIPTGTLSNPTYSTCTGQNDACKTAPGGNQAFCASQYCGCLASAGALSQAPSYCGYSNSSTTSTSASSTTTVIVSSTSSAPTSTSTPTYSTCTGQYDVCQTSPNANHAFCAAQYCGCLQSASALAQGPSYCQNTASTTTTTTGSSPASTMNTNIATTMTTSFASASGTGVPPSVAPYTGAAAPMATMKALVAPVIGAAGVLAFFI